MEATLGPAIAVGAVAAAAAAAVSSLHPSEAIAKLEQTDSLAVAANTMAPQAPLDSEAIQRIKDEYELARKGREATFLEEEAKFPPADGNKEARRAAFDAREAVFKHTIDSMIGEAKKGESQLAAEAAAEAATEAEWEKQGPEYAARMQKYKTDKLERLRVFNNGLEDSKDDDTNKKTRKEQFDADERRFRATAAVEAKEARGAAASAAASAVAPPPPPAASAVAPPPAAAQAPPPAASPAASPAAASAEPPPAASAAAAEPRAAASAAAEPPAALETRTAVVPSQEGATSALTPRPLNRIEKRLNDSRTADHPDVPELAPGSMVPNLFYKSSVSTLPQVGERGGPFKPARGIPNGVYHRLPTGGRKGGKRRTPRRHRQGRHGRLSRKSTFRRHRKH